MLNVQGAILTEFRGTVKIQRNGGSEYIVQPEDINTEKAIISDGAILSTDDESRADLQFTTGVSMRIGPGTKIKVEKTQVLTGENFTKVLLYLEKGSLYTKAPKLSVSSTVAITTPSAAAMVRGTEFYTEENNNKNITVVINGSVYMKSASGDAKILEKGKKSEIFKKGFTITDLTEKELTAIQDKGNAIAEISDTQRKALMDIIENSEEQKSLLEKTNSDYEQIKNAPAESPEKTESSEVQKKEPEIQKKETERVRDDEEFGRLDKKPDESAKDKTVK